MAKKVLQFTGDANHVGFKDYGHFWKVGDKHEVDAEVAKSATKTFPTLFKIAEPLAKEQEDHIKSVVEASSKKIKKVSNKRLGGDNK